MSEVDQMMSGINSMDAHIDNYQKELELNVNYAQKFSSHWQHNKSPKLQAMLNT